MWLTYNAVPVPHTKTHLLRSESCAFFLHRKPCKQAGKRLLGEFGGRAVPFRATHASKWATTFGSSPLSSQPPLVDSLSLPAPLPSPSIAAVPTTLKVFSSTFPVSTISFRCAPGLWPPTVVVVDYLDLARSKQKECSSSIAALVVCGWLRRVERLPMS